MADLRNYKFDPNVPENSGEFRVIPAGRYRAVIMSDEIKNTKTGTGRLLEMKIQIIDGEYATQEIVDRLNIINPSQKAERIGQGTLKRICSVCNVHFPPDDTRKLWGIPLTIEVGVESFKSNTSGNDLKSNKIKRYDPDLDVAEKPIQQPAQQTEAKKTWQI